MRGLLLDLALSDYHTLENLPELLNIDQLNYEFDHPGQGKNRKKINFELHLMHLKR